jgi:hypothetical protein
LQDGEKHENYIQENNKRTKEVEVEKERKKKT